MSAQAANMSFNKKEYVLFGVILIIALIATLSGLLNFNNEENNVALSSVQKYAQVPVQIDFADENNNYYVTDGEHVWKEKLVKVNGEWKAENIQKVGDIKFTKLSEKYN